MRLLLVDDQVDTVSALVELMQEKREWDITPAHSFDEALDMLENHGPFDAGAVDMWLGDGDGLTLIERARVLGVEPFLLMTMDRSGEVVSRAKDVGVTLAIKPMSFSTLDSWLDRVAMGDSEPTPIVAAQERSPVEQALETAAERYTLSPAECRVLGEAVRGFSRPEICDELSISLSTYDTHASRIHRKTGGSVHQTAIRILRWAVHGPGFDG